MVTIKAFKGMNAENAEQKMQKTGLVLHKFGCGVRMKVRYYDTVT